MEALEALEALAPFLAVVGLAGVLVHSRVARARAERRFAADSHPECPLRRRCLSTLAGAESYGRDVALFQQWQRGPCPLEDGQAGVYKCRLLERSVGTEPS